MTDFSLPGRAKLQHLRDLASHLYPVGAARLAKRSVRATARVSWIAAKVLGSASLGGGAAFVSVSLVASGSNILTSNDKVLLAMGTPAPYHEGVKAGMKAAERVGHAAPKKAETPEEALHFTRTEALFTFGAGLFVAYIALIFLTCAWCQFGYALGFFRDDEK